MTAKLHEVLAVEDSNKKAANKLIDESMRTLNKDSLFSGQVRKLEMFREEDKNSETTDYQELTTTVDENLDYLVKPVAAYWNTVGTKDATNQQAKAALIVEGKVLGENLPATFLLGLESKLAKLREVYMAIPTLEPGINWVHDDTDREGVFKTEHDTIQMKSVKDFDFRTVAAATVEHPAQVAKVERTLDIGRYVTSKYSGKMTPLEKANRLERIDTLLKAVKVARMRANNIDVEQVKIGEDLLKYINEGL